MSDIIFDLTNPSWKYKGVLSAIIDNEEVKKTMGISVPPGFITEIFAIIWIDQKDIWNSVMRLKFPSGSKQVFSRKYDMPEDKNVNETKCLQDLYKLPLKEKYWFKNPDETPEGIIEIMVREDLVLEMRVEKNV